MNQQSFGHQQHGQFGHFGGHEQGFGGQQGANGGQYGGGYGGQYGFNAQQGQQGGWGSQQGGFGGQQQPGQRSDVQFNPYTMDKDYNLISVLYHALQAVDTCAKYCEDARREGSPEVAAFMDQVRQQNLQISQQAKQLLFRQRQV